MPLETYVSRLLYLQLESAHNDASLYKKELAEVEAKLQVSDQNNNGYGYETLQWVQMILQKDLTELERRIEDIEARIVSFGRDPADYCVTDSESEGPDEASSDEDNSNSEDST